MGTVRPGPSWFDRDHCQRFIRRSSQSPGTVGLRSGGAAQIFWRAAQAGHLVDYINDPLGPDAAGPGSFARIP